jgi:hypothetical protein
MQHERTKLFLSQFVSAPPITDGDPTRPEQSTVAADHAPAG